MSYPHLQRLSLESEQSSAGQVHQAEEMICIQHICSSLADISNTAVLTQQSAELKLTNENSPKTEDGRLTNPLELNILQYILTPGTSL